MRLRVLAVGQKMPSWVEDGVAEYTRRMPREYAVEWVDIAPAKRGTGSPRRYREQEGELIRSRLAETDHLVALDVSGTIISTEKIAILALFRRSLVCAAETCLNSHRKSPTGRFLPMISCLGMH